MIDLISKDMQQFENRLQRVIQEADQEGAPIVVDILYSFFQPPKDLRVRPAVVFLAARANQYDFEKALLLATSVELTHIGTLIHRSINCEADSGLGTALLDLSNRIRILAGDYLLAKAALLASEVKNIRISSLGGDVLGIISEGCLQQIQTKYDWQYLRKDYYNRVYCQTAALFASCAEGGAIISKASNHSIEALKNYGYNLGMAFRLTKDARELEDALDPASQAGIKTWRQGIVTMPLVCLLEELSVKKDRKSIASVKDLIEGKAEAPNNNKEDGQRVLELISESEASLAAYSEAKRFAWKAQDAIAPALLNNECRQALMDLVDYVMEL